MIHLEVLSSPDQDVINSYEFHHNQIYLGHSRGNLQVRDPKLLDNHLMIEVIENDLLVHPQKSVEFYLLNGKRATEIRKIKTGDTIGIGDTTLKIRGFQESSYPSKKDVLNAKMNQLIEENSPRLKVVEKLIEMSKDV